MCVNNSDGNTSAGNPSPRAKHLPQRASEHLGQRLGALRDHPAGAQVCVPHDGVEGAPALVLAEVLGLEVGGSAVGERVKSDTGGSENGAK